MISSFSKRFGARYEGLVASEPRGTEVGEGFQLMDLRISEFALSTTELSRLAR